MAIAGTTSIRFAIKRRDAWFWAGELTQEEVIARYSDGRITLEWLVCPRGCADRAITIAQFIGDPELFERQDRLRADMEQHRKSIVSSVEKPRLIRRGTSLLRLFYVYRVMAEPIVEIFFLPEPNTDNRMTPMILAILVPMWIIGLVGLLCWIVGLVQHRLSIRKALTEMMEHKPDLLASPERLCAQSLRKRRAD